eukprot:4827620-Pyramimonas_sp.AAC.1
MFASCGHLGGPLGAVLGRPVSPRFHLRGVFRRGRCRLAQCFRAQAGTLRRITRLRASVPAHSRHPLDSNIGIAMASLFVKLPYPESGTACYVP